jgi:enamine deaminase RidA (YjgF/YER057c/UK114 family)
MATHAITKVAREGSGYSVVDLNDVRHVFAAATARSGTTLRQQADDALRTIAAVTSPDGTRGSIVHQAVFLADAGRIDECRRIIREFYGDELPATSYIPQPPCEGKLIAIEALGVGQHKGEVEIERLGEQLVVARHNGIAWVHCAQGISQGQNGSAYDAATGAFQQVRLLLDRAGVRFDRVIRTWLYLGGITDAEGSTGRYQEINRARADFYNNIAFLPGKGDSPIFVDTKIGTVPPLATPGRNGRIYPASTGIGTAGRGVMLSAIALATDRDDILAVPLENPRQTAAYDYSSVYSPTSPKFSRAMALSCGKYGTIFISGTASIVGAETRHTGDVAAQTHETLDNIAALISEENLGRHGLPGLGTSLAGLGLVRVYIKRPEDYEKARAVCEKRLGDLPTIYAVADVCRSDLLVEIEGVAFSRIELNSASPSR